MDSRDYDFGAAGRPYNIAPDGEQFLLTILRTTGDDDFNGLVVGNTAVA